MSHAAERLKCPFPYFGGKSKVAHLVWDRLGDVDNFIEPFCGSAAVLLGRPTPPRIETINDSDCYVSNFWRSTSLDPESVATHADHPVNEADLHARHRWLVLSEAAADFRRKIRSDPDYFDAKVAGWWCWGLCCWIGSGWCDASKCESSQIPSLSQWQGGYVPEATANAGRRTYQEKEVSGKRPILAGPENDGGRRSHYGLGVHSKGPSEQLPKLAGGGKKTATTAYGGSHVHADKVPANWAQRPLLNGNHSTGGQGVHNEDLAAEFRDANRPQLADAFSRGRGVHGNDAAGTCRQRREWLIDWFGRLRDRLRTVRVCCGDWKRVCDSPSVTTRLGATGIFLDPPYAKTKTDGTANRAADLYGNDKSQDVDQLVKDVRAYCLERGGNPGFRIALCGYEGEGHEELASAGWDCVSWKAIGGYGNRSARGKENSARERIWFSPHCIRPGAGGAFSFLDEESR